MAYEKLLAALLACCALGVSARLIEQVAVGTDSFAILEASDKEAIPFEVIESKDAYEIRKYEGGGVLGALHCHCSLAYERECPQLGTASQKLRLDAGEFAATEEFQSPFTISYTKACDLQAIELYGTMQGSACQLDGKCVTRRGSHT